MTIRFFAGVSVKTAQTMTVELFPTPIRSTAVGIGAMIGRAITNFLKIWGPSA